MTFAIHCWGLPGFGEIWEFLLRSCAGRGDYWPVAPFRPRPQAAPRPQHGGHTPFLGELSERNLGPEPPPAREGMEGSARTGRRSRRGWGNFRRFEGRVGLIAKRDPRISLPELEMRSDRGSRGRAGKKSSTTAPQFSRHPLVNLAILLKNIVANIRLRPLIHLTFISRMDFGKRFGKRHWASENGSFEIQWHKQLLIKFRFNLFWRFMRSLDR